MWALRKIAPMTMTRLVAAVPKRYVMSADETSFANEFIDSLFPMFPAGANFDLYLYRSAADVGSREAFERVKAWKRDMRARGLRKTDPV